MSPLYWILASIMGVGLGLFQIRLTVRLMKKPNFWLAFAKLPIWGLAMLAAAYLSIWTLLFLTTGAVCTYLGYIIARWRKGDEA